MLDNASHDATIEALQRFKDPRLLIHSNNSNKGFVFNLVKVFDYSDAEFSVSLLDQDDINVGELKGFIEFLREHDNISCGYCVKGARVRNGHVLFACGYDSIRNIAYKGRHPTGYFFRTSAIRAVSAVEKYTDYDMVDLFPLEFAIADTTFAGVGAVYCSELFTTNSGKEVAERKSATTDGRSQSAFFSPHARLKIAASYSRHIGRSPLSASQKGVVTARVFTQELIAATIGYRAVMSDETLCAHYRMQARKVSTVELINTAFLYCARYLAFMTKEMATRLPFLAVGLGVLVLDKIQRKFGIGQGLGKHV